MVRINDHPIRRGNVSGSGDWLVAGHAQRATRSSAARGCCCIVHQNINEFVIRLWSDHVGGGGNVRKRRNCRASGDLPQAAAMCTSSENVQIRVQLDLEDLSVWKPRTEAGPGGSSVSGKVNTILGPHIKGTVGFDLKRPPRLTRKIAADVRPGRPAVRRTENMTAAELVDHGVGNLGVARIHLKVVDPAV